MCNFKIRIALCNSTKTNMAGWLHTTVGLEITEQLFHTILVAQLTCDNVQIILKSWLPCCINIQKFTKLAFRWLRELKQW